MPKNPEQILKDFRRKSKRCSYLDRTELTEVIAAIVEINGSKGNKFISQIPDFYTTSFNYVLFSDWQSTSDKPLFITPETRLAIACLLKKTLLERVASLRSEKTSSELIDQEYSIWTLYILCVLKESLAVKRIGFTYLDRPRDRDVLVSFSNRCLHRFEIRITPFGEMSFYPDSDSPHLGDAVFKDFVAGKELLDLKEYQERNSQDSDRFESGLSRNFGFNRVETVPFPSCNISFFDFNPNSKSLSPLISFMICPTESRKRELYIRGGFGIPPYRRFDIPGVYSSASWIRDIHSRLIFDGNRIHKLPFINDVPFPAVAESELSNYSDPNRFSSLYSRETSRVEVLFYRDRIYYFNLDLIVTRLDISTRRSFDTVYSILANQENEFLIQRINSNDPLYLFSKFWMSDGPNEVREIKLSFDDPIVKYIFSNRRFWQLPERQAGEIDFLKKFMSDLAFEWHLILLEKNGLQAKFSLVMDGRLTDCSSPIFQPTYFNFVVDLSLDLPVQIYYLAWSLPPIYISYARKNFPDYDSIISEGLSQTRVLRGNEPSIEKKHLSSDSCVNCIYYLGQRHGGNFLHCAVLPFGPEGSSCNDFRAHS